MSVNSAEPEAECYLVEALLPGRVSVACINSPTNVTLSGDKITIDQLQVGLEKDDVFARKPRTGVAYHSPAMYQVAGEYLSSLGRLEPRELYGGNPFMVLTVISQKVVIISLLDPQYWVDNLESPVRFADALQYVVNMAPKVDGLKPITNYLEIRPHRALQRLVRDSLAYAGNSTARYSLILSKQDVRSKTILQLVGQLASGTQAIRGYHVKEATFTSPIVVTPGQTTEEMTYLRPLQQTYERSSTRFEIEIFSYAENSWRVCCKYIIYVEFEHETRAEVDGGQELQILTYSLARKYANTKSKADMKITSSDFYRWLHENGFRYGPSFSLADEVCWDGDDLAIAQVNVGPPVESFEESVVHPGVLDSCLQLCPIPPSQEMSTSIPTSVPHKIKDAWIAETGWQNPSTDRIKVLTQVKFKHAGAGLNCEVAVLSETGALLCYITRLEMSPVMARELGTDNSGRTLLHHIDWKPNISLCTMEQPHSLCNTARQSPGNEDATVHDRIKLEEILRSVAQQNIDRLWGTDWEKVPARIKNKLQDLGMKRPSWKMSREVAQSLLSIVRGEPHELELSLSSALFQDGLDNAMAAVCNQDLEAYLGLLAHQRPKLVFHEITAPDRFEIGFGFGVTADWWLLKDNGFSGTDLVIRDYQNDAAHCSSLMVSREAAQLSLPDAGTRVLIVIDDDFQKSLAQIVLQSTSWNSRVITLNEMADEKLESSDYIICLADVYRLFLHPMRQATLNTVRNWVQQSTNLFWVTAYDTESTALPSSYPYAGIKDGLLRTLRFEFALNRIIPLTIGDSTRDITTCARYILNIFESVFIRELSAAVEPHVIYVPEVITEAWLPGPPLTLAIQTRRQLETLQFREDLDYYHEPGPTDVEIEAKVWGIGFRDVFLALSRLDKDDFRPDCAGIVTRVGAEVQSVKVGDCIYIQTTDGMKTYPRAHEWTTAKIVDSVSFEDACAIIISGMSALQSLVEVARLQKGEKVLIYSASGGTGQLALQIAQMVGAEVFATVGYDHNKQLLIDEYSVRVDHIFYSRDISFARGVMRTTNGYGVNVVLNSLVGESLRASWECIAPYGRMIEIGQAEIDANASLPMASFAKNILFAGVALHRIVKDINKKELAHKLLEKTMDLARDRSIRAPRPLHIYNVDSVGDAFRYLATGKNTGRIVIRVDPSTNVQKLLIKRRSWTFDENATYLIKGGLGGIGRSILRWMVTRGVKYLLVPSRSGTASAAASEVMRELSVQNIVVSTPKCDVSSKDSLSHMLEESATTLPPIRGCIVATMVLKDCTFENMTLTQWDQTSRSKVESSWNLYTLLPDLGFFILLSSVSGVVGNPGQSNYAAGCTFQDALARHRSQRGQKAVSIDLGVVRSIGIVAETERLQQHSQSSKGFIQVEEAEFLSLLDIYCDPSYHPEGHRCQMVMGPRDPRQPPRTVARAARGPAEAALRPLQPAPGPVRQRRRRTALSPGNLVQWRGTL
ncbi:MAG: hypothetical protein Q9225_005621 [Loekoesia sp. 1 TL-2023]